MPEENKFTKDKNNSFFYFVRKGDTLTKISAEYKKKYNVTSISLNAMINLIVSVNERKYSSVRKNKINQGWSLQMPASSDIKALVREIHTLFFDGKKLEWKYPQKKNTAIGSCCFRT